MIAQKTMKRHFNPHNAIKAGLVIVFTADDLIFGALSKKGVESSHIAKYALDKEKFWKCKVIESWINVNYFEY